MSDVAIRVLVPSDWQLYRDLRLNALAESPDAFGSTHAVASQFADSDWAARLQGLSAQTDLPMVAVLGTQPAGLAWAKIEDPGDTVAHVYQMWVDPIARGRGVGRALLQTAFDWARNQDVVTMMLEVTVGNGPARGLYESMGFEPIGEPQPVRPGSDLVEQTMVMTLASPGR